MRGVQCGKALGRVARGAWVGGGAVGGRDRVVLSPGVSVRGGRRGVHAGSHLQRQTCKRESGMAKHCVRFPGVREYG